MPIDPHNSRIVKSWLSEFLLDVIVVGGYSGKDERCYSHKEEQRAQDMQRSAARLQHNVCFRAKSRSACPKNRLGDESLAPIEASVEFVLWRPGSWSVGPLIFSTAPRPAARDQGVPSEAVSCSRCRLDMHVGISPHHARCSHVPPLFANVYLRGSRQRTVVIREKPLEGFKRRLRAERMAA